MFESEDFEEIRVGLVDIGERKFPGAKFLLVELVKSGAEFESRLESTM